MVVSLIQDIMDCPYIRSILPIHIYFMRTYMWFLFLNWYVLIYYSFKFTEGKGKKNIKIMVNVIIYSDEEFRPWVDTSAQQGISCETSAKLESFFFSFATVITLRSLWRQNGIKGPKVSPLLKLNEYQLKKQNKTF